MDTPTYYSTRAICQADGVIEATAALKGLSLLDVAGGIAINSCDYDGQIAHVRPPNGHWTRVRVVDCVKREHAYYHSVTVWSALELSYQLALQFNVIDHNPGGGVGMYDFEVCLSETLDNCHGIGVPYRDWFIESIRYE